MKNMKPIPAFRKDKQAAWELHIKNWQESGLTQKHYCEKHQLKLHTFQYWKSRIHRRQLSKPLLPVTVKPEPLSAARSFPSGISISVNDRWSIQLDVCFNQDTLLSVLDLLESRYVSS